MLTPPKHQSTGQNVVKSLEHVIGVVSIASNAMSTNRVGTVSFGAANAAIDAESIGRFQLQIGMSSGILLKIILHADTFEEKLRGLNYV